MDPTLITPPHALRARRTRLANALGTTPALLAAGLPRVRNYRAWTHPFRATSHFLYLTAQSHTPGAFLYLEGGRAELYLDPPGDDHALWHGEVPSWDDLKTHTGVDAVRPLSELRNAKGLSSAATLPPQDDASAALLSEYVGRQVPARSGHELASGSPDAALADAMIALRLHHDDAAIAQLRAAATATAAAHAAGVAAARPGRRESEVRAAMEAAMASHGVSNAYLPIVTVRGEVLHNEHHTNTLRAGDLLLADVGAESPEGWAGDVTRVWAVGGEPSASQREAYAIVLAAQKAALDAAKPGARYRDVHRAARRTLVSGLVDAGVFRGSVDDLDARGAGALFFPHGVGHLIGLDVHDMEDLGDRAGYAPGRSRASAFGESYLRLDRDLEPGMAVTIEPGFYQVPALLNDARYTAALGDAFDRKALARFADVRGIRIEDDILITASGHENLTAMIAKSLTEALDASLSTRRLGRHASRARRFLSTPPRHPRASGLRAAKEAGSGS